MAMGGARVGAGRRGYLEEKTAREIVSLSANTIYKALQEDSPLDFKERVELSRHFVIKSLPSADEEKSDHGNRTLIYVIDRDGTQNRVKILSPSVTEINPALPEPI